jgi:hypothetical protein
MTNGTPDADAAKRTGVKRTNYSPWTARGLRGSARSTPQQSSPLTQQHTLSSTQPAAGGPDSSPARVTSDVLQSTEAVTQSQPLPQQTAGKKPSLSGSNRIMSAQARWERQNNEARRRTSRASSESSDASVSSDSSSLPSISTVLASSTQPLPAVKAEPLPTRKRSGDGSDSDPKRAKTAERTAAVPPSTQHKSRQQQTAMDEAMAAAESQLKSLRTNSQSEPYMKHKTGGELLAEIKRLTTLTQTSPAKRDVPTTERAEPEAIVYAPPPENRRYDSWKDSRGAAFRFEGLILPTGYTSTKHTATPWVCPVKGCVAPQSTLEALKGHFKSTHRGQTFRDNRDGTISMVGSYASAKGDSPAIIVSIGDAPGATNGAVPTTGTTRTPIGAKPTPAIKKVETPVPLPQTMGQRTVSETKRYLTEVLPPSEVIPNRSDIAYLLQLQKKRDLPDEWIRHHNIKGMEPIALYAVALAYITGDEVTGEDRCQRAVRTGKTAARLSDICVRPPAIPSSVDKVFTAKTCVGCKYVSVTQRQTNTCDWSDGQGTGVSPMDTGVEGESTEDETRMSRARHRQRPRQSRVSSESTSTSSEMRNPVVGGGPDVVGGGPDAVAGTGAGLVERAVMSAATRAASQLEMEEWEFAPGRMEDKETSESKSEDLDDGTIRPADHDLSSAIAMSCGHLTGNQPITVADNIGLHDIVVGRGRIHQWPVENDKLRLCYIAAGKVQVKIGGQTYRQGPNSSLVIRPGKTCIVENRFFQDAIIHCTVVDGYSVVDS